MTDQYNEGYQVGLTWTNDYRPGGPSVCTRPGCIGKGTCPGYEKSHQNRIAWLQGFDDGLAKQTIDHKTNQRSSG